MYVDSHAHYDLKYFNENRSELLKECKNAGIGKILMPAIRIESCDQMREKMKTDTPDLWPEIFYAVGVHPTRIFQSEKDTDPLWEKKIRETAKSQDVVAIGEAGLDYHYEMTTEMYEKQHFWFHKQLEIAEDLALPLIFHIRMADQDAIKILRGYPLDQSGLVHCYNYGKETAKQFLDMDLYFWIGGSMTYPEAHELREAVKYIPLDRILLETDAPYVKPVWWEEKLNTSLVIPRLAEEVAALKGIDVHEVCQVTSENFQRLFQNQ